MHANDVSCCCPHDICVYKKLRSRAGMYRLLMKRPALGQDTYLPSAARARHIFVVSFICELDSASKALRDDLPRPSYAHTRVSSLHAHLPPLRLCPIRCVWPIDVEHSLVPSVRAAPDPVDLAPQCMHILRCGHGGVIGRRTPGPKREHELRGERPEARAYERELAHRRPVRFERGPAVHADKITLVWHGRARRAARQKVREEVVAGGRPGIVQLPVFRRALALLHVRDSEPGAGIGVSLARAPRWPCTRGARPATSTGRRITPQPASRACAPCAQRSRGGRARAGPGAPRTRR
jgi:hypothetical protein